MPHVVLVTLSGFRVVNTELRELGITLPGFADRAAALTALPALGLITLAGQLPNHWTCEYRAPECVDEDLIEAIASVNPDLVAVSSLTPSVEEGYRLSSALRERDIRTVLGGLHVSTCPEEASVHADAIVVGSGEAVWPQLLEDCEQGRLQPRYVAARNQRGADWVRPRYDLLGSVSRYTMQTHRGCPLACDFCGASRLIEAFREKPLASIRNELADIKQLSKRPMLELADDNTFAGDRDVHAFLDAFQEADIRWFTEADWRAAQRPDLLGRLAAAGCVQILTGLESTVFRYPGMAEKEAELEEMIQACNTIQAAGVAVNACFIVGADGETRDSIHRLGDYLAEEAPFAEVQVTLQTPFPGTGLRRRLQREGRLLPDQSWSYYNLLDVTFQPDHLTVEELERGFHELVGRVYGAEATRRRRQIRSDINAHSRQLRRGSAAN